jgi:thiol-disulfide isomerase/thioredoxin
MGSVSSSVACSKSEAKVEPAGSAAEGPFVEVRVHPSGGEKLSEVLAREAKKAGEKKLRPFVEIGASWCEPCRAIESSMSDERMKKAFEGTYVIHLDADEWGGKLGEAGVASAQIPVFFALEANGKPNGRRIDGGAWDANVPANMAPKLGAFFKGP